MKKTPRRAAERSEQRLRKETSILQSFGAEIFEFSSRVTLALREYSLVAANQALSRSSEIQYRLVLWYLTLQPERQRVHKAAYDDYLFRLSQLRLELLKAKARHGSL